MDDTTFYQALRGPRGRDAEDCLRSLVKKSSVPKMPVKKNVNVQTTHAMSQDIQKRMSAVVEKLKAVRNGKVKKADVKDELLNRVKAYAPELIGGGLGAAAGGTYGYLSARRKDPKKPSAMELDARELLRSHERAKMELRKDKKKPGLAHKMQGVYARAFADAAKVMRDHPVATGAMFGGLVGSAGAAAGRAGWDTLQEHTRRDLDV